MTFTPLHLELLAMIDRGAAWAGLGFAVAYRDLADHSLTKPLTGSLPDTLTLKGQAMLKALCDYAEAGCYPATLTPPTPDLPLSEPVLPVEAQLRDIREWLAAQTGFMQSQCSTLIEIRDLLISIRKQYPWSDKDFQRP